MQLLNIATPLLIKTMQIENNCMATNSTIYLSAWVNQGIKVCNIAGYNYVPSYILYCETKCSIAKKGIYQEPLNKHASSSIKIE